MRIVQTLWTAGQSLTANAMGWLNPQMNLMSWALSANSMREHTDDLVLYTDTEGARTLVDRLKLPYTEVVVAYDGLEIPKAHWAIPKIMSYARQDKPFVHADGDLYLPNGLPHDISGSPVIVQNEEEGSDYYRKMMDGIMLTSPILPDYLEKEMQKPSIGSYNAGLFGGNDIDFIHKYCHEAMKVIHDNKWDSPDIAGAHINYNLLFEQILLYALAKDCGQEVTPLLAHRFRDDGYTRDAIADLPNYESRSVIHLLGGHKRNHDVTELMRKTLLRLYPDSYMRVLRMFEKHHYRLHDSGCCTTKSPTLTAEQCVARYLDMRAACKKASDGIPCDDLLRTERLCAEYLPLLKNGEDWHTCCTLHVNGHSQLIQLPTDWPREAIDTITRTINGRVYHPQIHTIAFVPMLEYQGYRETPISDMGYNIITLLHQPQSFTDLLTALRTCVSDDVDGAELRKAVDNECLNLLSNGIIYMRHEL